MLRCQNRADARAIARGRDVNPVLGRHLDRHSARKAHDRRRKRGAYLWKLDPKKIAVKSLRQENVYYVQRVNLYNKLSSI